MTSQSNCFHTSTNARWVSINLSSLTSFPRLPQIIHYTIVDNLHFDLLWLNVVEPACLSCSTYRLLRRLSYTEIGKVRDETSYILVQVGVETQIFVYFSINR